MAASKKSDENPTQEKDTPPEQKATKGKPVLNKEKPHGEVMYAGAQRQVRFIQEDNCFDVEGNFLGMHDDLFPPAKKEDIA